MYDDLIKALRENADWCGGEEWNIPICMGYNQREASDAIEKLQSELEQAKKERAAAVEDLKSICEDSGDGCGICKHLPCAEKHGRCIGWQWRGVKEDTE